LAPGDGGSSQIIGVVGSFTIYNPDRDAEMSSHLGKVFYHTFGHVERAKRSSNTISDIYRSFKENRFLWPIVGSVVINLKLLHRHFRELVDEALRRSPENLASAAREWKSFANHYINRGDSIPDHHSFVEIQERLGFYARTHFGTFPPEHKENCTETVECVYLAIV